MGKISDSAVEAMKTAEARNLIVDKMSRHSKVAGIGVSKVRISQIIIVAKSLLELATQLLKHPVGDIQPSDAVWETELFIENARRVLSAADDVPSLDSILPVYSDSSTASDIVGDDWYAFAVKELPSLAAILLYTASEISEKRSVIIEEKVRQANG